MIGYKLADGSYSSEYKIGDRFITGGGTRCFSVGSVLEFYRDDGSDCPLFKLVEGKCDHRICEGKQGAYESWRNLYPVMENKGSKDFLELFTTSEHDATKLDAVVVNGVRFIKES